MTKATDIQTADHIAVLVDFATAHCALGTSMIIGRVDRTTDKAVCIEDNGNRVWFPKKALVKGWKSDSNTKHFALARWFRPSGSTAYNMDRMMRSSVIAA